MFWFFFFIFAILSIEVIAILPLLKNVGIGKVEAGCLSGGFLISALVFYKLAMGI